jgi:hypothetical protein
MKYILVLCLTLSVICSADFVPFTYRCKASLGQDWSRNRPSPLLPNGFIDPEREDGVYSSTDYFEITEKNRSEEIKLTNRDFKHFQTETRGDNGEVIMRSHASLRGFDLQGRFGVSITLLGNFRQGDTVSPLYLSSDLCIRMADLNAPVCITTEDTGSGTPQTLRNEIELRLPLTIQATGPIYYRLTCNRVNTSSTEQTTSVPEPRMRRFLRFRRR